MAFISIIVEEPGHGIVRTVQVPDDEAVNLLVINLISEFGLPECYGSMPISYGLEYPAGHRLRNEETLRSTGVQSNDQLYLRVLGIAAVSDLQVRRLRESFAMLGKPALPADIRPMSATTGYVARLVIETTPMASTQRTAPIPISSSTPSQIPQQPLQAAGQRTSPQPITSPQFQSPRQPPQAVGQRTSPQPIISPQSQPILQAPQHPQAQPTARGGIIKWVVIGTGMAALLVVIFFLGLMRGNSMGTGGDSTSPTAPTMGGIVVGSKVNTEAQSEVAQSNTNPTPVESSPRPTLTPKRSTPTPSELPQVSIVEPEIVSRNIWGGQPTRGNNGVQTPRYIAISHDGQSIKSTTDAAGLLRSVQRNHLNRGWVDIAWHFAIDQHGVIYAAHDPNDQGDTSYDYDTNGIITVGVLGDYDTQTPSSEQIEAVVSLLAWLCQKYSISPDDIYPHSFFANSSPQTDPKITSPGQNFDMTDIRVRVRDRLEK